MSDITFSIAILVTAVVVAILIAIREETKDKKITVIYGYPAYSKVWLTVYHYRKKDLWVFEKDDLFADERPSDWDLNKHYLYAKRGAEATEEEIEKGFELCRKRGYL